MTAAMPGTWKCILCEQLNPDNAVACRGCGLEPCDAFDVEVAIMSDLDDVETSVGDVIHDEDLDDVEEACKGLLADALGG